VKQKQSLRTGIVGMGPIGSILAAHLIEAGQTVIPCDIDRRKIDRIKSRGIRLEGTIQKQVMVTEACHDVPTLADYDPDLLILAVKASFLTRVLEAAVPLKSDKLFVMCAQNGIDNEREAARYFGRRKTLRMVINFGGGMVDPNTVRVTFFNPPNYVAALHPEGHTPARRIADLLNAVQLATEIPENIQRHVWEKAILNATLNPICAITGKTMKEVMDFPPTVRLVQAVIDESLRVAEAEGLRLGENFRELGLQYLRQGGRHRPSMLVDLDRGQKTEIGWLNEKIAAYGRKHSVPTPINLALSALIRLLEQSKE